jgi:cell division protein FtsW
MKSILNKLHGDKYIWLIVLLLSIVSLLAVYSSTHSLAYKYQAGNTEFYLLKHFTLLVFGVLLMYVAHLINYRYYSRFAQLLLYISVPLLLFTLLWGTDINEARRWITLPMVNISFQTSDLAKLALIMYTARMLSRKQDCIKDFKGAFIPIVLPVFLICGLIMPADLSTAAILFVTCLLLMFIGRINLKYLASMLTLATVIGSGIIVLLMNIEGQGRINTWQERLDHFFSDRGGEVYQVQQSKIAIAEGGVLGKGPGNSDQRNFLPHPYADFIYSIIIEEYGLLGGFTIIMLYLALLYRAIKIVLKSPHAFGALLAVGLSMSLVFQAMINMGVAVNLLPVTGLTLPLVSMGGSSLWFTSISVGIILSVSKETNIDDEQEEDDEPESDDDDEEPKGEAA